MEQLTKPQKSKDGQPLYVDLNLEPHEYGEYEAFTATLDTNVLQQQESERGFQL
jgi:hypothetical protein